MYTPSAPKIIEALTPLLSTIPLAARNSISTSFFYDHYYESCAEVYLVNMKKEVLSEDDNIELEFYCIGALHIAKQWIINGAKESPKHMDELTQKLMPEKYWKYF